MRIRLPGGIVGQAYSQPFSATGGTSPYTWSIQSGALPPGLTISSGGVLSGTPTTVGSSTFTVRVADAATPTQVTLKPFTLVISPIGVTITTNSPLPQAFTKLFYSQTLECDGRDAWIHVVAARGKQPPTRSHSEFGWSYFGIADHGGELHVHATGARFRWRDISVRAESIFAAGSVV